MRLRWRGGRLGDHLRADDRRRHARPRCGDVRIGFWQGTFREPGFEEFAAAVKAIQARNALTVDVMNGDFEGGQRTITRFSMLPRQDDGWLVGVGRHWNIDRDDPR